MEGGSSPLNLALAFNGNKKLDDRGGSSSSNVAFLLDMYVYEYRDVGVGDLGEGSLSSYVAFSMDIHEKGSGGYDGFPVSSTGGGCVAVLVALTLEDIVGGVVIS